MANTTIPNLPLAVALTGSEQLEIVQAGTSMRTTTGAIIGTPLPVVAFAGLPAPTGALTGVQYVINDAASSTYAVGALVTGGGVNTMRVWCSGTAWVAG